MSNSIPTKQKEQERKVPRQVESSDLEDQEPWWSDDQIVDDDLDWMAGWDSDK